MNPEELPETLETCGHDVELIEVTLQVFPPETFPDRVQKGRPPGAPPISSERSRTAQDEIHYGIPSDPPDTTPPG